MAKPNAVLLDGGIQHASQTNRMLEVAEFLELGACNEAMAEIYGQVGGIPNHFPEAPTTDYFTLADALVAICEKVRKNRDDIKDLDDRVKALEQA